MSKNTFIWILIGIVTFLMIVLFVKPYFPPIRNKTYERFDSTINVLDVKISKLNEINNTILLRDSLSTQQVTVINNNYKNIYEKTNDTSFNEFIPIIDSLLTRHKQVKFERNY